MKKLILFRPDVRPNLNRHCFIVGWVLLSIGYSSSVLAQTVNATCNEATDPARTEFTIDPNVGGCQSVDGRNYFFFPPETSDGFPLVYADGPNAGQQPNGGISNSTPVNLYVERMGSSPFTVTIGNFGGGRCSITVNPPAGTTCAVDPPDPENVAIVGIPCYVNGRRDLTTQSDEAFLVVSYEAGMGADALQPDGSGIRTLARDDEIGSTYGVAYNENTGNFYTSATLKRHADIGPGGTGAIYRISTAIAGGTPTGVLGGTWIDLNADPNISTGTIGTGAQRGLGGTTDPNRDITAFNPAGRIAIGDIDLSPDNNTLYAVSLNDKQLVTIDVADEASPTVTGALGINTATTGITCSNGELMPFGLGVDQSTGDVYLGCTCNGQAGGTSADLEAYVLRLNTTATGFEEALAFPLDYQRNGGVGVNYTAEWQPWNNSNNYTILPPPFANRFYQQYPQALVANIEILDDGSMLVGLLDRFGLQTGSQNIRPDQTTLAGSGPDQESGRPCGDMILFAANPAAPGTWLPTIVPHSEDIREDPPNAPTNLYSDYFSVFENAAALGSMAYLRGQNDPTTLTGDEFLGPAVDPTGANQNGIGVLALTNPPARLDNQNVVDAGTQPRVAAKGLALGDVELGVLNPTCVITDLTVTCGETSATGTTVTVTATRNEPGETNTYVVTVPGYTVTDGTDNVATYGAPATFTITPALLPTENVTVSVQDSDEPTCMATTTLDGSTCAVASCELSISDVTTACDNGTDFTTSFTVTWDYAEAIIDMIEVTIDGDAQTFTPVTITGSRSFTDVALTGPAFGVLLEANFVGNPTCDAVASVDLIACTEACTSTLGGNVFNDSDDDGADAGAGEGGRANVLVEIYACDDPDPVYTTFTNSDGDWSVPGSIDLTYPVRVEFSTPLQPSLQPGVAGVGNGSNTQFIDGPTCEVNYGVVDPDIFCGPAFIDPRPLGQPSEAGILLSSGIAVITCGSIEDGSIPMDQRYTLGLLDLRGLNTAPNRPQIAPTDFHRPDWTVDELGNIFGTAIDTSGNFYATASSHYGAAFGYALGADGSNIRRSILRYGNIGGGANDLAAAGTIYRMDAVTGAPTVFVSLPQQSFNFTHVACEDGTTFNRTSGPGLGNITFDETNGQFFVSNFEDGAIYRLDQDGNILDSFDPQTLTGFRVDDGTAGFANDFMPYGLVVAPQGDRLYFGVHPVDNDPATPLDVAGVYFVDLAADGGFTGTEQFLVNTVPDPTINFPASQGFNAFGADPGWVSVSDLTFNPDGNLVIGQRTGCGDGTDPAYASSHNHGATYVIYDLEENSVFNVETRYAGDNGATGGTGNDDVYGGVGIWDTRDGDYLYAVSSSDIRTELGPHGIMIFPDDFTQTGNGTSEFILRPAAAIPYFVNFTTNDFKGVGGDIDVYSPCGTETPIQIGNYVWFDDDQDGVQDPCEEPVTGLPVTLYTRAANGDLTQVDMTTTDATTGEYYFDDVLPDTTYLIVFGDPEAVVSDSTLLIDGLEYRVTRDGTGEGSNPSLNDSDGVFTDVDGNRLPAILYNTADTTDHTLDLGFSLAAVFDLALIKQLDASTNPGPYGPDSTVDFSITVYNQGDTDATDVEVKDYVPAGLSLAPASAPTWAVSADTAILTTPFALGAGEDTVLSIRFVIDADFMGDTLVNRAEISSFDDDNNPDTPPPTDEDSTPNDNGTDDPEADSDDEIDDDGPGTPGTVDNPDDEDDYDFAGVPVLQNFDLNLVKRLDSTATPGPFTFGSTVTYTIEVRNQGTLDATDVEAADYVPDGLTLVPSGDWVTDVDTARTTTSYAIPAGDTLSLAISFTIDDDFSGMEIINTAEITAATNALGLPDEDSTPGDNGGDDPETDSDDEDDDDGPNGNGVPDNPDDSDDFDLARISVETVSLGSTVFLDNDNDGFQNGADAGIPNVEVQLWNATTNTQVATDATGARVADPADAAVVLTDGMGNYHFTNLPPGDYFVIIPTAPATAPISSNNTGIPFLETTPNDDLDNDDEGLQTGGSGAAVTSGTVSLAIGAEPENGTADGTETGQGNTQDDDFDDNGNMTLDFGFFAPVSVGDTAFVDLNEDGLQTIGEPGLGGVTVTLLDGNGDIVTEDALGNTISGTTVTAPDGSYLFGNLPPGSYSVIFDVGTADNAENYTFTTPNAGDDTVDSDNTTASGDSTAQSDPTPFLNSGEQDLTLDVGVVCNVSVAVAEPFTVCSTQPIDLTAGVTISPDTTASFGATWTTPDGTGDFVDAAGNVLVEPYRFGTAVGYLPSAADASRGEVTFTLTTDDPAGPCDPVSASVTVRVLKVDCGEFFWDGQ